MVPSAARRDATQYENRRAIGFQHARDSGARRWAGSNHFYAPIQEMGGCLEDGVRNPTWPHVESYETDDPFFHHASGFSNVSELFRSESHSSLRAVPVA